MAVKEYLMTTTKFNKPKIVKDQDAIYTLLVKLALLEPGTYESHPDMGLGLHGRYRYSYDANRVRTDFKKQIQTYLPMLNNVEVLAELKDYHLLIQVRIDDVSYPLYINTASNKLEDYLN